MLDSSFRPVVDRVLGDFAKFLARKAISANHITFAGLLLVLPLVVCLAYGQFLWALALVILNRLLDGLDGMVARIHGVTDLGGYWDIVADFLFYASIPVGFSLYAPENGLASTLLLASYMGTSSSFLTYAIVAVKRGMSTEVRGKKSFYHLGGLVEGTETIGFVFLVCVLPQYYPALAMIFAALCGISTLGRMFCAYQDFRD